MTAIPAFQITNCIAWNEAARKRAIRSGRRRDARRHERNIKDLREKLV